MAGGIGDLLSPAFGSACTNEHTGAAAQGTASTSTGTGGGNALGVPAGSPLNHCGGADGSLLEEVVGDAGRGGTISINLADILEDS
jgi:hypothetical protein